MKRKFLLLVIPLTFLSLSTNVECRTILSREGGKSPFNFLELLQGIIGMKKKNKIFNVAPSNFSFTTSATFPKLQTQFFYYDSAVTRSLNLPSSNRTCYRCDSNVDAYCSNSTYLDLANPDHMIIDSSNVCHGFYCMKEVFKSPHTRVKRSCSKLGFGVQVTFFGLGYTRHACRDYDYCNHATNFHINQQLMFLLLLSIFFGG
ncbi:hypothetical protein SNEBB_004469 [Seison nebaliae]|nr:hypothetical protein SNEBB_004469 [Seison nebaliae]